MKLKIKNKMNKGQVVIISSYKTYMLLAFLIIYSFILIACDKKPEDESVGDIDNNQLSHSNIGDHDRDNDKTIDMNEGGRVEDDISDGIDNTLSPDGILPSDDEGSKNQDETVTVEGLYVIGDGVRMREEASIHSDIILQLGKGSHVEYIKNIGDWIKVDYDGEIGFIRNDLLSDTKPVDSIIEESQELIGNSIDVINDRENVDPAYVIDNPRIVVKKNDRKLELWDGDSLFESFSVGLGWNPVGDKQKEGDGRTPEGVYYVCTRNSYSRFYLSLGVSYPNKEDAREAFDEGLIDQSTYEQIDSAISQGIQPPWNTSLGGEIMIHGHGSHSDWTAGCVAVDDEIMDILWKHCPLGTPIIIEP